MTANPLELAPSFDQSPVGLAGSSTIDDLNRELAELVTAEGKDAQSSEAEAVELETSASLVESAELSSVIQGSRVQFLRDELAEFKPRSRRQVLIDELAEFMPKQSVEIVATEAVRPEKSSLFGRITKKLGSFATRLSSKPDISKEEEPRDSKSNLTKLREGVRAAREYSRDSNVLPTIGKAAILGVAAIELIPAVPQLIHAFDVYWSGGN